MSLSGGLTGQVNWKRSREYNGVRAFVHVNADKLAHASRLETLETGARSVVGALLRWLRPGHGNELQHYQRLQTEAIQQQQRLSVLLGWLGATSQSTGLPGKAAAIPADASIRSFSGQLAGQASAVGVQAGGSISVERVDIEAEQWIPYRKILEEAAQNGQAPEWAARDSEIASQRQHALEANHSLLFLGDKNQAPLQRLATNKHTYLATSLETLQMASTASLQTMANNLRTEFEYLCAVALQRDDLAKRHDLSPSARKGAADVEHSLLNSWQAKTREEALANMERARVALWLAAAKQTPSNDKTTLLENLKTLANELHAAPIQHDGEAFLKQVSVFNTLELQLRERSYALNLGGSIGPLSGKAQVSLTERSFNHLNPLRAGEFKDVRVTLAANLPFDQLWNTLAGQLAAQGISVAELPIETLAGIQAQIGSGVTGQLTWLFRFYQPAFQKTDNFPADAAGHHLQFVRLSAGADVGFAGQLSIPLQPGLSLELGASAGASRTQVLSERWGEHTLSTPMMQLLHLKEAGEDAERWPELRKAHQAELMALFKNIANEKSTAHHESEYFLKKGQATDQLRKEFFSVMNGFSYGVKSWEDALLMFEQMATLYFPAWQDAKNRFHGWREHELPLPSEITSTYL
ncbi:hypothetical protein [Chromobacterium amazonense]|uniref:hypothetical protein n=1 Tax=Chromobacterium amazonense TaxID=1382803 RepID=UPI0011B2766C|nr:hypothetical protein [Chromobacterium amazonense]